MSKETRLPAEVFKLAIDLGYYNYWDGMCIAIDKLELEEKSTRTEERLAISGIGRYMDTLKANTTSRIGTGYLRHALRYCGLPYDEAATTALYLDWDNRPYKDDN